ncbi:hypothetical protein [Flavobacterium macacae]|uniref:Uncharacterized protein n=1 Tax=Flavobacterium macacae TaxID=2488993 RepID=A0A3P3WA68_9FLAO|nr:hypothetical protein [Flavobacterium macacae]RRJ90519.1 hypothetical protein EG849_10840 [Flavobacterium macacae]
MKNNENSKEEKKLVRSMQQARTVLDMFLLNSEKSLESGISELLDKLKNPNLDLLLDRYPDLLREYELEELLSGDLEIRGAEMQDVKTAGLLSCLQLLAHFCGELKEHPDPEDRRFDSLRYILNSIACSRFIKELLLVILSVVGTVYYEKFQLRIQNLDLNPESEAELEKDPEMKEHINLMTWLALARLFLESVYTYFSTPDKEMKNTT